jgi:hypothetical protein
MGKILNIEKQKFSHTHNPRHKREKIAKQRKNQVKKEEQQTKQTQNKNG